MTQRKPRRINPIQLWVLIVVSLIFPIPLLAMSWTQIELDHAQELLSWGEFDSVIQVLKPSFHPDSVESNPMDLGWAWLGIAYHGLGNSDRGDQAFRNFLHHGLDRDLEPSLTTPEMKARFASLKQEMNSAVLVLSLPKKKHPDSVSPSLPTPAPRPSPAPKSRIGMKSAWILSTVGVVALVAGGGTIWWYNSQPKPKTVVTVMNGREEELKK